MKRAVLIALALIVLLVAGAAVYIVLTFRPDDYRPAIEEAISRKIGRKVTMGKLSLSFAGGVGVEVVDFHVVGDRRNPDESPVKFRRGRLIVALLPLFKKEVIIKKVVLDSPRIYVRKYSDGTLSVDDVFESLRGEKREKSGGRRGVPPITVRIESVQVKDGGITYVSEGVGGKPSVINIYPFNLRISRLGFDRDSDVSISIKGTRPFSFSVSYKGKMRVTSEKGGLGKINFELKGKAFGIPGKISGELVPRGRASEFQCVVSSSEVSPEVLADIYEKLTDKRLPIRSEGAGKFLFAAGGTTREFGFELEVDVTESAIFFDRKFEKYSGQSLALVIQGRYIQPKLFISNGEFRIPNLLTSVNAEFDRVNGKYDVSLSLDVENVRNVLQYFPTLVSYHATGGITASLHLVGKGSRWKLEGGAADLKRLNFDLEDMKLSVRNMQGHVELKGREVTFNPLSALVNGQRLTLSGHGEMGEIVKGVFSLSADYLDLDSLLKQLEEGGRGAGKAQGAEGREIPLPENLDLAVEFRAGGVKAAGVELKELEGTIRAKGGEVEWENTKWKMFGGVLNTEGNVSLAGAEKRAEFTVVADGVSAFELLKSVTSLGGVLDGSISLEMKGTCEADSIRGMLETLKGQGILRIKKGKMVNVDVVRDVLSVLGRDRTSPRLRKLRKFTEFEEVEAPFRVKEGSFASDEFAVRGKDFSLKGKASFSSHGRFEFTGDLRLPRSLARGLNVPYSTKRPDGVYIPVRISGPLNGLKVLLDPKKVIEKKGRELMENIIREKLFRKR